MFDKSMVLSGSICAHVAWEEIIGRAITAEENIYVGALTPLSVAPMSNCQYCGGRVLFGVLNYIPDNIRGPCWVPNAGSSR